MGTEWRRKNILIENIIAVLLDDRCILMIAKEGRGVDGINRIKDHHRNR